MIYCCSRSPNHPALYRRIHSMSADLSPKEQIKELLLRRVGNVLSLAVINSLVDDIMDIVESDAQPGGGV